MIYDWNREKDEQLQVERGVSFLDVVEAVSGSGFLADIAHPNHGKYGHQRVLVVDIGGYAYYVPMSCKRMEQGF